MKFHLSFFDFCLRNQPNIQTFANAKAKAEKGFWNARVVTKTKYVKAKPCTETGFAALYDTPRVCNNVKGDQGPNFHAEYNNLFQSRSSMTGFKKALYNRAKLVRNQLFPSYNRRKYHISHYNQIKKQCTRLSRTYGYLSQKKINHFIAFASKYDPITRHKRPCVKMIHLLESQLCMIMYRSLFTKSIMMARQPLIQQWARGPMLNQGFFLNRLGSGKKSQTNRLDTSSLFKTQNQNHILPGQLYRIN